jgi:hypothetical protein
MATIGFMPPLYDLGHGGVVPSSAFRSGFGGVADGKDQPIDRWDGAEALFARCASPKPCAVPGMRPPNGLPIVE